ncbi:MAG: hypothetical protein C7B43_12460 [Sulfobacillus benefaciens]|jgi:hypothetical protein|uniref:Uncharacterized protein n=1 Tax=Sulfobacillus benefaciens TaxID=453960 RepID=A0A2T2WY46_9FIRM|nr:MAG: hypothetical protein C7B43_12460 [Sulfobacillus benefaciens]HBQ95831.1 hypothetical protein [Sulfobacillus sp.]
MAPNAPIRTLTRGELHAHQICLHCPGPYIGNGKAQQTQGKQDKFEIVTLYMAIYVGEPIKTRAHSRDE